MEGKPDIWLIVIILLRLTKRQVLPDKITYAGYLANCEYKVGFSVNESDN